MLVVRPQRGIADARELEQAAQSRVYAANNANMRAGGWLERRRTERTATEAKTEHQELAEAYRAVQMRLSTLFAEVQPA